MSFGMPWYYSGLANPHEKDIFLEIDMMSGDMKPEEGIVKGATRFAENDIKLHIDARLRCIQDASASSGARSLWMTDAWVGVR